MGSFARVSSAGESAVTRYRTLRNFRTTTEVEIDLVTGRYNQARLHFATAGFPLVGERKYARGRDAPLKCNRVALHAIRLAFIHPKTGRRIDIPAPLPPGLHEPLAEARTA